ncbi:MAG: hypothetical protein ACKVYV_05880 [Limisphaerales bacterium]
MFARQALSPEHALIAGLALLALSASVLILAIWRFGWLQEHFPKLLRWGRGDWSFPATQYGVISGCLVGIMVGGVSIDSWFGFLPRADWAVFILTSLGSALVAAVFDFRRHRLNDA